VIALLLATGLLLIQDPPAVPESQATAPPGAASSQPDARTPVVAEVDAGDRMICRRERVVGSNRPQRICTTQRQRAEQAQAARNEMSRRDRAPEQNVSGNGDVF
jgi:hypothetical protein